MPFAQNPATALLACGALMVFVLLVTVFVRSPGIGIGLLMAGQFSLVLGDAGPLSLDVGGMDLTVLDVLVAAAILAVVVQLAVHPRVRPSLRRRALWLLCAVVLGSLLAGVAAHGVQAAGNDARTSFLYVFGPALYVVAANPRRDLTAVVVRTWTAAAVGYVLLALVWWSQYGVGSSSSTVLVDGHVVGGRGVPAVAAFLVAQAAVMLLVVRGTRPRVLLVAGPLLLTVLLLQHRSAWTAIAAMACGWLLLRPGRVLRKAVTGGAVAFAATAAVILTTALPADRLTTDLAESASNDSTWEWRVTGWLQLIDRLHGTGDWLFGLPFGSGYDRLLGGVVTDVNPHSYYVLMLLRVGLLGLALLLGTVLASLRSGGRTTSAGLLMWLLAAGEAVYWLTYEPTVPDGLLLGLMVRYATRTTDGPSLPVPKTRDARPVSVTPVPTTQAATIE